MGLGDLGYAVRACLTPLRPAVAPFYSSNLAVEAIQHCSALLQSGMNGLPCLSLAKTALLFDVWGYNRPSVCVNAEIVPGSIAAPRSRAVSHLGCGSIGHGGIH